MYDFYGNPLLTAYAFDGSVIWQDKYVFADTTDNYCTSELQTNISTAYNRMVNASKSISNPVMIGFITDQHGRGIKALQYLHNVDDVGITKVNLGDTATDFFNQAELYGLRLASKRIDKYIGVVGNHDAWTRTTEKASNDALINYFTTSYAKDAAGSVCYYSVTDSDMGIKYIVLNPYFIDADGTRIDEFKSDQIEFIIDQLLQSDNDIIVFQHQLLWQMPNGDATATMLAIRQMLIDFNNRATGTITDDEGLTHAYDFANASHKVLCTLHGHWHREEYDTNGIISYAGDWYGNKGTTTFVLIDKDNPSLHLYIAKTDGVTEKTIGT